MESKNFEYNIEEDILYIYKSNNPVTISGSIVYNNLVFDISSDGVISGIQIENASKFLNINKNLLENIKTANLRVITQSNTLLIGWEIQTGDDHAQTINNNFVFPRNKLELTC